MREIETLQASSDKLGAAKRKGIVPIDGTRKKCICCGNVFPIESKRKICTCGKFLYTVNFYYQLAVNRGG